MSVIFLAGVHGVGKSFLGALVANQIGISYLTASQLIREEKGRSTWSADKLVGEIDDNQLALVRAVSRRHDDAVDLLLDGHFVLRDSSGDLVRLDKSVFRDLKLTGVILLTEDASVIVERFLARDGTSMSVETITELAVEEQLHACSVCTQLGIPLVAIPSANALSLTSQVIALMRAQ